MFIGGNWFNCVRRLWQKYIPSAAGAISTCVR
jgi:hypothetical protein